MRKFIFTITTAITLYFGASSTQAVTAKFADPDDIAAWEEAEFDPPTLWFTVEFHHGDSNFEDVRAGDSTAPGYSFSYSYDNIDGELYNLDWDPNTAEAPEEYKNDFEMTFLDNSRDKQGTIGADNVSFEWLFAVYHDGTPWKTLVGSARYGSWYAKATDHVYNAGVDQNGTTGTAVVEYINCSTLQAKDSQNIQLGNYTETFEWLPYCNDSFWKVLLPPNSSGNYWVRYCH